MDRDNIRRPNTPQQAGFIKESELDFFVLGQPATQYLKRDETFQFLIPGSQDHRESASCYFIADFKATDIRRQHHARTDPLKFVVHIDAMKNLDVEDIVITVGRADTDGDGVAADTGRRSPLSDVGWIVGVPVPTSLLNAVDRLRISADLLNREILSPPDVKVVF
jgi:hypothetical protein